MTAAQHDVVQRQSGEVYAHIVEDLRQSAVTTDELASIAGVHSRQVQNWAAGRNKPQGQNRDHLLELHYLVKRLRDVYQPEGVEIWLHGRNRDLDGQRPLDLLRAGEFEAVLSAVERLVDGTM
jgi:Antitoxin Xre/MbcA/ParS C-terminal toxin-binding domain